MSNTTIKYNICYEFFSSLANLISRRQGIKPRQVDNDEIKRIENYYDTLEQEMNPIMKQDFDLALLNFSGIFIAFYEIATKFIEVEDCLQELKSITTHELLNRYLRRIHVDLNVSDADSDLIAAINKNPITDTKSADAESFMLYKYHAAEIKHRYCSLLESYYHKFFKKFSPHLQQFMDKTVQIHQQSYDSNPNRFMNELIWYKSEYELEHHKPVFIYTLYFSYAGQALWNFDDGYYHHYGFTLLERLDNQNEKQLALLFKTLADSKRLQMLKLLSRKSLYSKELAELCQLTPATTSYHMSKIVESGLAKIEWRQNNKVYYSLNKEAVRSKLREAAMLIIN